MFAKNLLAATLWTPLFIPYQRRHLGVIADKGSIAMIIGVAAIDLTY
jgi:hypothetical protein